MRDDYKPVTVAQLLNHTAGLPTYLQIGPDIAPSVRGLSGTPAEQRTQFIERLLMEEPIVKPGTESRYSNAGYALVGFVAEQRTGQSWETLMTDEIFKPLAMTNAGFGRPRSPDRQDEPWLHEWTGERYEPEPEDRANALTALAPAGNVHCSIRDFAKFAAYELQAARGHNTLLSPATARRFRELARRPAREAKPEPKRKTGPGGPGGKSKLAKGPKSGPLLSGNGFYGGSAFISSGCMLWPDKNVAAVVAINAGGGHPAINQIFHGVEKTHN
jgi:CubicO group peptidase (beta-lactamase class C family)